MLEELARHAVSFLEQGEDLAWVSVLETRGSAPRHAGAHMLVMSDASTRGTIGGGALEARAIRDAAGVLRTRQSRVVEFDLTNQEAGELGMICGGRGLLLLQYLSAKGGASLEFCRALITLAKERRKGWLVTAVREGTGAASRCLVDDQGKVFGDAIAPIDTLRDLVRKGGSSDQLLALGLGRIYLQPVGPREVLYIFGAGHCGQRLAEIAHLVGFLVIVIDDRADFASPERFPMAERLVVPESFENAFADLAVDEESYLVIMTRGHLHDKTLLAQALRTPASYIGMIGSKKKIAQIFNELEQQGTPTGALARVHAPIGLDIGSETPEEIAVSIVAELIQERAKKRAARN